VAAHRGTPDCQDPDGTPGAPPTTQIWTDPSSTPTYGSKTKYILYKHDAKRNKPGYSSRGFFLEPPAEDADNALKRLSPIAETIASGKSSEHIKLCSFRYDFIASRSTFISFASMRDMGKFPKSCQASIEPLSLRTRPREPGKMVIREVKGIQIPDRQIKDSPKSVRRFGVSRDSMILRIKCDVKQGTGGAGNWGI